MGSWNKEVGDINLMINRKNFVMNDPNSQVKNYSHSSPSIVSEPPDIRNWFPSYNYQSPILDTNELFGDSLRVDDEERGLYVEDSENEEEEENWDDLIRVRKSHQSGICDRTTPPIECKPFEGIENHSHHVSPVKVSSHTDSLSLPSEPPDIRNWFSSYVYESPTLDSADFDISLLYNNDFGNIQDSDKAKEKSLKEHKANDELFLCKLISSDGYATNARFSETDFNNSLSAGQEKEGSDGSDFNSGSDRASGQGNKGPAPKSSWIVADKSTEVPRVKAESPLVTVHDGQQTSRVNYSRSPPKAPSRPKSTETGEIKAGKESIISETDSGWILPNPKLREPLCESINKDNRHLLRKNEHNSLHKKTSPRKNDENLPTYFGPSKCNNDSNGNWVPSTYNGKDVARKREALKETTNFLHSCKMEVAGKWRCPQKNKPNTGPPLKQLRLERWLHRL